LTRLRRASLTLPTALLVPFNLVSTLAAPTFHHPSLFSLAKTLCTPGDSKSTSQKLSDQTGSSADTVTDKLGAVGQNVQETASNLTKQGQETASNLSQQAQSNTGAAGQQGQTYLEQAQNLAANALNAASNTAASKILPLVHLVTISNILTSFRPCQHYQW
jgi:hypothetical protein